MTLSDDLSKKSDIESDDINYNNNFTTISNDEDNNVVNDKDHNNKISASIFIRSNTKIKTKNFRFNEDEFINEYLHVATRSELSSDDHIFLWWKSNDFRRFKIEAINEIKDIVKLQPHFNLKQAMSAIYQSESQELIDNTCRNSRRFITLQQQINEKSHKNNNKCSNTNKNVKKDYDDSRKDDDNNDKNDINDEDCVIQIRSRFLCSRKHFQCSKKQEDNVVVPNNNIIATYHTNNKIEAASNNNNINNKTSYVYNNNQDDNVHDNIHDHDNYCDEKNRIVVYDDTSKLVLVLKTYSQRFRNYHFILTAYLILWLCAVWGIVFHQVITFYKYQKQQK